MKAGALIYCGTPIRDRDDHLCLTDMWRADGSPENREPWNWARKEGTRFIEFTADNLNLTGSQVLVAEPGRGGGTWAHWQIGMAYAQYLSSEFHTWCNEVVRAHMQQRTKMLVGTGHMLNSLFDQGIALQRGLQVVGQKVDHLNDRVERIDDKVIVLSDDLHRVERRVDDLAPRRLFSSNTRKQFVYVIAKFNRGLCPCCDRVEIVDQHGREIEGAAQADHFNGRERNKPEDGWLVCKICNRDLHESAAFKVRARPRFEVFQQRRFDVFGNGNGPSPRVRRRPKSLPSPGQLKFVF